MLTRRPAMFGLKLTQFRLSDYSETVVVECRAYAPLLASPWQSHGLSSIKFATTRNVKGGTNLTSWRNRCDLSGSISNSNTSFKVQLRHSAENSDFFRASATTLSKSFDEALILGSNSPFGPHLSVTSALPSIPAAREAIGNCGTTSTWMQVRSRSRSVEPCFSGCPVIGAVPRTNPKERINGLMVDLISGGTNKCPKPSRVASQRRSHRQASFCSLDPSLTSGRRGAS